MVGVVVFVLRGVRSREFVGCSIQTPPHQQTGHQSQADNLGSAMEPLDMCTSACTSCTHAYNPLQRPVNPKARIPTSLATRTAVAFLRCRRWTHAATCRRAGVDVSCDMAFSDDFVTVVSDIMTHPLLHSLAENVYHSYPLKMSTTAQIQIEGAWNTCI